LLAPEKAVRLAQLVRDKKPRVVVEAGTAIGYSGLWIGRELKHTGQGKLITMEINRKIAAEAEANFRQAGLEPYVTLKIGDAREIAKEIDGPVDFLFLDCIPRNYYRVFLALEDKLSDGAIVFADNAGYGAGGMRDYLEHVRTNYDSRTEWFDIDLPWAKRDAVEITVVSHPRKKTQ
jgi:predicted O-methyltransferase YrrM